MRVWLAAPARTELQDAQRDYERERPRLGLTFGKAVASACARMGAMPRMYPVEIGDVRKLSLTRFPYKLLVAERGDVIVVLAVSHHRRKAAYWIDRLQQPDPEPEPDA